MVELRAAQTELRPRADCHVAIDGQPRAAVGGIQVGPVLDRHIAVDRHCALNAAVTGDSQTVVDIRDNDSPCAGRLAWRLGQGRRATDSQREQGRADHQPSWLHHVHL